MFASVIREAEARTRESEPKSRSEPDNSAGGVGAGGGEWVSGTGDSNCKGLEEENREREMHLESRK